MQRYGDLLGHTYSLDANRAKYCFILTMQKEVWDELRERFAKSNHFRILDLLQEINSIKQGERNNIEYYTNSKILWEKQNSIPHMCLQ